jgi:hypothetical protein
VRKIAVAVLIACALATGARAASVPDKEYTKDAHTTFLCHFNSAEEVKGLSGVLGATVTFVPGKFGQGVQIEKSTDWINFPATGKFNQPEGSIEMMVKTLVNLADYKYPTDPHPYMLHLFKNDNNWMGLLYNDSNRTIVCNIACEKDGTRMNCYPQAAATWKPGDWHHVACSWGKGSANLYLDGKLAATQKYDAGIGIIPDVFTVGSTLWHSNQAKMVIDELRISDIMIDFNKAEDW